MIINLEKHWDEINTIAKERTKLKKSNRIKTKKQDSARNDFLIQLNGLLGEYAIAEYLNVPVNKENTLGGDGGHDLEFFDKKIEVKYNTYDYGDLYFDKSNGYFFKADVAFLVVPTSNEKKVRIVGWITRKRFKQIYKIKNYGKGPRQAVTQDKLTDLEKFTSQVKIKYNYNL